MSTISEARGRSDTSFIGKVSGEQVLSKPVEVAQDALRGDDMFSRKRLFESKASQVERKEILDPQQKERVRLLIQKLVVPCEDVRNAPPPTSEEAVAIVDKEMERVEVVFAEIYKIVQEKNEKQVLSIPLQKRKKVSSAPSQESRGEKSTFHWSKEEYNKDIEKLKKYNSSDTFPSYEEAKRMWDTQPELTEEESDWEVSELKKRLPSVPFEEVTLYAQYFEKLQREGVPRNLCSQAATQIVMKDIEEQKKFPKDIDVNSSYGQLVSKFQKEGMPVQEAVQKASWVIAQKCIQAQSSLQGSMALRSPGCGLMSTVLASPLLMFELSKIVSLISVEGVGAGMCAVKDSSLLPIVLAGSILWKSGDWSWRQRVAAVAVGVPATYFGGPNIGLCAALAVGEFGPKVAEAVASAGGYLSSFIYSKIKHEEISVVEPSSRKRRGEEISEKKHLEKRHKGDDLGLLQKKDVEGLRNKEAIARESIVKNFIVDRSEDELFKPLVLNILENGKNLLEYLASLGKQGISATICLELNQTPDATVNIEVALKSWVKILQGIVQGLGEKGHEERERTIQGLCECIGAGITVIDFDRMVEQAEVSVIKKINYQPRDTTQKFKIFMLKEKNKYSFIFKKQKNKDQSECVVM